VQQPSAGRHAARHTPDSPDTRPAASRDARQAASQPPRRNNTASWYRWFAVLGVVALVAVAFAYRGQIWRARLSSTSTTVPLLGSSVLSLPDLATDTSQFGRMPIVRVYYPGLPNPNAWSTGLAAANHSAVIVSFKALPTDILSGADDSALRHFFDTAPTAHPIYYTYYHEPEDNIERGEFNLANYKAAWAHVVAIANAAHHPNLHSTLILMSWDLDKASHRNWRDYLPGGGIISTLGWDAYPVGSATNVNPQLTSPTAFMGPAIAAAKSVGLPYGFPEFGLSTAKGRPGWLDEVGNYLMKSGALFASYFDGNTQYPTLRLTDAASIKVWKDFVTQSRNGDPAPNPSPSASPSPSPSSSPPAGLHVAGLKLSPATVSLSSEDGAALTFSLSQRADITVCVLNSSGAVKRTMARPGSTAGATKTIKYLVYQRLSHRLAAGNYTVLVVASNSNGSSSAAVPLTITP
jgi:hypothetical protein